MSRTPTRGAGGLVLAAVLLAGCTGTDGTGPASTGTTDVDGTAGAPGTGDDAPDGADTTGGMPASVEEQLAALDPDTFEVLGTATGEIPYAQTSIVADVLRVTRHEGGLDLTFRLTPEEAISNHRFSLELSPDKQSREIGAVRLVSGDQYVGPLVYRADPDEWDIADTRCLCSKLPQKIGTEGFVLHATFPDFDSALETVSVSIPGFEEIEDVPVD